MSTCLWVVIGIAVFILGCIVIYVCLPEEQKKVVLRAANKATFGMVPVKEESSCCTFSWSRMLIGAVSVAIPIWYYWGTISRWFRGDKESPGEEPSLSDIFQKPRKPTFFEKYATKNNLLGGTLALGAVGGACAWNSHSRKKKAKKKARKALVDDPVFQAFVKSRPKVVARGGKPKSDEDQTDEHIKEFRAAQLNDPEFTKFLESKHPKVANGEKTPEFRDAKTDAFRKEFEKTHDWVADDSGTVKAVKKSKSPTANTPSTGNEKPKSEKRGWLGWIKLIFSWLDVLSPLYWIPGCTHPRSIMANKSNSDDAKAAVDFFIPLRFIVSYLTYSTLWSYLVGWIPTLGWGTYAWIILGCVGYFAIVQLIKKYCCAPSPKK